MIWVNFKKMLLYLKQMFEFLYKKGMKLILIYA